MLLVSSAANSSSSSSHSFEHFTSCFGFGLGGGGGGARRPCITLCNYRQSLLQSGKVQFNVNQCDSHQTIADWLTEHFWYFSRMTVVYSTQSEFMDGQEKRKNMLITSWRELWNAFIPPVKVSKEKKRKQTRFKSLECLAGVSNWCKENCTQCIWKCDALKYYFFCMLHGTSRKRLDTTTQKKEPGMLHLWY